MLTFEFPVHTASDPTALLCSTPFGLYRDGTELRAVYYSKEDVALAACGSLGDQCDYAILLGSP